MVNRYQGLAHYLTGKGAPLTNKDFSEQQLNALRQAVFNRRYEIDRQLGIGQRTRDYNLSHSVRDRINPSPYAINYGNYYNTDMGDVLGRFFYNIDNNGNVIINDRYDVNGNEGILNPKAMVLNMAKASGGVPYNINLNLGNPNTWGNLRYTGNKLLGY